MSVIGGADVIPMLLAVTPKVPLCVPASQDILEMDLPAQVSLY